MPTTRTTRHIRSDRGSVLSAVWVGVLVLFLVAVLAAVVALTFSVQVSGHSMEPTLKPGDRLEVDLLHRGDISRFDVVEAEEPDNGTHIVKRIIGMPGDKVAIAGDPDGPTVYLRPAGSKDTFIVDNPTWTSQVGSNTAACCTDAGKTTGKRAWATVPEGSYWLIGDNWGGSTDSRVFGFVKKGAVKAKLSFRILPRDRFGGLTSGAHLVPVQN